jgi:hypothetical protein
MRINGEGSVDFDDYDRRAFLTSSEGVGWDEISGNGQFSVNQRFRSLATQLTGLRRLSKWIMLSSATEGYVWGRRLVSPAQPTHTAPTGRSGSSYPSWESGNNDT